MLSLFCDAFLAEKICSGLYVIGIFMTDQYLKREVFF